MSQERREIEDRVENSNQKAEAGTAQQELLWFQNWEKSLNLLNNPNVTKNLNIVWSMEGHEDALRRVNFNQPSQSQTQSQNTPRRTNVKSQE